MLNRAATVLLALSVVSCASLRSGSSGGATTAAATLRDATGATVGTASLSQTASGVLISASLTGVGGGTHGIHVHTTGRCDGPDFASAGGHFNPTNKQHGFRNAAGAHVGDLPNVSPPQSGALTFDVLLPNATLSGDNAVLDADGAAIVVHASADDYVTDPSGNSSSTFADTCCWTRRSPRQPRGSKPCSRESHSRCFNAPAADPRFPSVSQDRARNHRSAST